LAHKVFREPFVSPTVHSNLQNSHVFKSVKPTALLIKDRFTNSTSQVRYLATKSQPKTQNWNLQTHFVQIYSHCRK